MKLTITADVSLDAGGDSSFVTRFDVRATRTDEPCVLVREGSGDAQGSLRAAMVHVGEIADAQVDLHRVLAAARIESLHDVYFESGWYRDEYADGAGIDLLVIEDLVVDRTQRARNLDLAMVRRLCDTIGSGAQLAVLPYGDAREAARWAALGFVPSTPGRSQGLLHMKLGFRTARVVDTGAGHFEVMPTFAPMPRAIQS